jgi:hypothetical protein
MRACPSFLRARIPSHIEVPPAFRFITDEEKRQHWYSDTWFAEKWRWVTTINPMATNITFNGGLILSLLSWVRLHEDAKARAAAAPKDKKKK